MPELSDGHHLLVSNGGFDLRRLAAARAAVAYMASDIIAAPETAPEYRLIDQLLPFAVADRSLAAVSERTIAPGLTGREDLRAFVARPRVWVISHRSDVDAERFGGTIDLAIDDIALIGDTTDGGEEARQRLWYGVLQTALETEIARSRLRQAPDDSLQLSSVSLAMPALLTLLEGASATDVPAGSALARALDGGDLAVTVGDVERTGAFWAIDPVRGATRSVQEPGLRPSSYGGSYPGGGGGAYEILPDGRSRRLNAPQRQSGGGGLEYQVVQGVSLAIAVVGAFSAGWLIGRLFVNACDWIYGD